jgi:uncharacterized membrane protein YfcA
MYWFILLIISIITGISSGMFGIGGSIIATPLLLLMTDIAPNIALASPLPVAVSSALSGSILYFKENLIDFKVAYLTLLFAFPFSLIGTYLTEHINISYLLSAKAVFLLVLGIRFFLSKENKFDKVNKHNRILLIAFTGMLSGFVAGILALGGGVVLVTAFTKLLKMDLKSSIATSLFSILILAVINSFGHYFTGNIDIRISIFMMIAVLPFSYLGAYLSVRMKNRLISLIFGILLIIFAIYSIIRIILV